MAAQVSKYITIIRPEFMAFCKDACRSAALNHLLFRISGKCKDQPREKIQSGEILWYAKTELIASEMSDAWGVCKVRKEVNELVSMGLFGRKSNPTWGVDRTKHFCFGSEQCEAFIKYCENNEVCIVHLDLPAEVKHLIYSSLANDRTIKCTCEKADLVEANDKSITCIRYIHPMHSIDLSPAFDKSIEAITKTSTKTSNKDNSKEDTGGTSREENSTAQNVANATTPARHSQISPTTTQGEHDGHHNNNLRYSGVNPGSADGVSASAIPAPGGDTQRTTDAQQQATISEQDSVATPDLSTSLPPSGKAARAVTQPPSQQNETTKASSAAPTVGANLGQVDIKTLTITAHINFAFKWLDAVRQKAEKNPRASYVQNKTASGLIRNLIEATMNTSNELTEQNIYIAWMAMWKSPAGKDGFTWGEPGKISIAAFCRNYGEYLARGQTSLDKAAQSKAAQTNSNETGVSGLKRWRAPGSSQAVLAQ